MPKCLTLPPIPNISIEEKLEYIKTSIHEGFEHIYDFEESIETRFEEIKIEMDQIIVY